VPLQVSGQLSLLRVHERGSKYGPPSDQIDVEVVVQFRNRPNDAFGFQLRDDAEGPAREGMLGLLRDGFNHGWTVTIDYDISPGHHNGVAVRVWLTKPAGGTGPVLDPTVLARRKVAKSTSRRGAARTARRKGKSGSARLSTSRASRKGN
jgi:hypothetical protein